MTALLAREPPPAARVRVTVGGASGPAGPGGLTPRRGCRGRRCGRARSGWKAPVRRRRPAAGMRRTSGSPSWPSWRCAYLAAGPGLAVVSPGWADLDRGLFSISVAAELAGLHPQTLRIYEREGLLDPARSAGGTRRYSRRDIDRLAEICALTADGLNLAGIRRVLHLQEETRQLQAELARLRELAGAQPAARHGPAAAPPPRQRDR